MNMHKHKHWCAINTGSAFCNCIALLSAFGQAQAVKNEWMDLWTQSQEEVRRLKEELKIEKYFHSIAVKQKDECQNRHAATLEENEKLKAENEQLKAQNKEYKESLYILHKQISALEELLRKAQSAKCVECANIVHCKDCPNCNPPQPEHCEVSGAKLDSKPERKPHKCPVCDGVKLSREMINCNGETQFTAWTHFDCYACNGTGLVWEPK